MYDVSIGTLPTIEGDSGRLVSMKSSKISFLDMSSLGALLISISLACCFSDSFAYIIDTNRGGEQIPIL